METTEPDFTNGEMPSPNLWFFSTLRKEYHRTKNVISPVLRTLTGSGLLLWHRPGPRTESRSRPLRLRRTYASGTWQLVARKLSTRQAQARRLCKALRLRGRFHFLWLSQQEQHAKLPGQGNFRAILFSPANSRKCDPRRPRSSL